MGWKKTWLIRKLKGEDEDKSFFFFNSSPKDVFIDFFLEGNEGIEEKMEREREREIH